MKLWGGRFTEAEDQRTEEFNESLSFDKRMYRQDITGSIAHAEMLGRQGIISQEDSAAIIAGLKGILQDIEDGKLVIEGAAEDIHSFAPLLTVTVVFEGITIALEIVISLFTM